MSRKILTFEFDLNYFPFFIFALCLQQAVFSPSSSIEHVMCPLPFTENISRVIHDTVGDF